MEIFDSEGKKTESNGVAMATPQGVSLDVVYKLQLWCQVSITLPYYLQDRTDFVFWLHTRTTDDVISYLICIKQKLKYLWNERRYYKKENAILVLSERPFEWG